MFRKKFLVPSAAAVLLLTSLPGIVALAQDATTADVVTTLPSPPPSDVLGYLSHDGGKTWSAIKEQPGVAERIPAGTGTTQFMEEHSIPPEAAPYVNGSTSTGVEAPTGNLPTDYSVFYEDIYYSGQNQLAALPGTSIPSLSVLGMDNMFSSLRISSYARNGCTIFDPSSYGDPYYPYNAGPAEEDYLGHIGWNDRISSLILWPR